MTLRNFYNLHFTVWRIYGRAEKNVKGKNKFISKSISWSINPPKPIKITVKDSQVGQGGVSVVGTASQLSSFF